MFFCLILIFSIRIIQVSLNKFEIYNKQNEQRKFSLLRRDIVDRNGELISRNVKFFHAAINPAFVKNKDNFLLKLRLNFPEIQIQEIEKKLVQGNYFYLKSELTKLKREIMELG